MKNKITKVFLAVLLVFVSFFVFSCELSENTERADAKTAVNDFLKSDLLPEIVNNVALQKLSSNIVFADPEVEPTEQDLATGSYSGFVHGVRAWVESSNPEVVHAEWITTSQREYVKDDKGVVVDVVKTEHRSLVLIVEKQEEEVTVELTIHAEVPYVSGEHTYRYSNSRTITVTVEAKEKVFEMSLSELMALAANDWVGFQQHGVVDAEGNEKCAITTRGIVTEELWGDGFDNHSFMINDGEASLYVYAPVGDTVEIGDYVEVTCVPTTYYGIVETSSKAEVKVLYGGQEVPAPKATYTVDELYENVGLEDHTVAGQRYRIQGILQFVNNNFELKSDSTDKYVQIYYKAYTDYEKSLLESYVGSKVEIETAIYDAHSAGYLRLLPNVYDYPIVALEMSDQEKVNAAKAQLEAVEFNSKYEDGEEFELPAITVEGVELVWDIEPATALVDGVIVAEEEGTLTLTATLTCGEASDTFEVVLNIAPKPAEGPTMEVVDEPVAGETYKLYVNQVLAGKEIYFSGVMSGNYLATTTELEEAVDVLVEEVEGGFRLSFVGADQVKKYIDLYEYQANKVGVRLTEEPTAVFTWNAEAKTFVAEVIEGQQHYLGCYKTYVTVSASSTSYITGDNAANVDVSQFPARMLKVPGGAQPQPQGDKVAPVITIADAALQQLAAATLYEGESLVDLFAGLKAAITINDDVDGAIALTDAMINLGGLDLAAPVAGTYTIKISASDAAGNAAEKTLEITIVAKPELEELLVLDFEESQSDSDYVNPHWLIQKYTTQWDTVTSVQMRSRGKDGSRVVNMAGGYSMTMKYTYTPDEILKNAELMTFRLGNYFTGAQVAQIKVVVVYEDDSIEYLLGSQSEFYAFHVTTTLEDFSLPFTKGNVKAFYIAFKSTISGNAFIYLDDVKFFGVKEDEPQPAQPLTVAEALAQASQECPESGNVTADLYEVKGIVVEIGDNKGNYLKNVYLADTLESEVKLLLYTVNFSETVTAVEVGDTVVVKGYVKNYNGTIEMATANSVFVTFISRTPAAAPADTTAPVFSIEQSVLEQFAQLHLQAGDSLVDFFAQFKAAITITDDVDGVIALTDEMIDLGGLSLESPAAGQYVVTFTASDGAGNVGTQTLTITINEKTPEYDEQVVHLIDFEDGAGSGKYENSHWKQEKYTDSWVEMTGQMNSRTKDNKKVVNIVGGWSMTNKYTYTPDNIIERVTKIQITFGNYYTNAQIAPVKVAIVLSNDQVVYLLGSASEFCQVDPTPGLIFMEQTINQPINIKAFYIVFKSTVQDNVYFYLDDITFIGQVAKDTTAPVITVASAALQQLASTTLYEGESLVDLFAGLKAAITINDDFDGAIALTDEMIDLGGLDLANPVAGTYTIKISASDTAGNAAEQSLQITVVEHEQAEPGTSAETAFSASEALAKAVEIGQTASTDDFYVKGIIREVTTAFNSQYNNISITITDGATDFLIYRLGCTADESETLVAGKEVVVCGKLINYKGNTPEMTSGGALISVADPETPFDLVAPVITIADAALQQLAAATLYEGESLVDLFAGLKAAITINDDVDGQIALTDEMIDLGGLDLLAPVAGKYTIKVSASDAAGNAAEQSLQITVVAKPAEAEYEELLVLDFEDGAGSGTYSDAHWTQEKYQDGWVAVSNQMNSRAKDGSKVANMTSGWYMTYKYTYTPDETLKGVSKFAIDLGNYYSAKDAQIKIALVKSDDSILYVVGDANGFHTVAQTTGMDIHIEETFDAVDVKAFYISFKSEKDSAAYLYMDNVKLLAAKEDEPEEPETVVLNFANNNGGTSEISAAKIKELCGNDVVTSVTDASKVYGTYNADFASLGLKFGTSKANGAMTLTLSENVTKIKVVAAGWTTSDKLTVNGVAGDAFTKAYSASDPLQTMEFEFDAPTNTLTFAFAKRGFIQSIELFFE